MRFPFFVGCLIGTLTSGCCQMNDQMEDYAPARLPSIPETAVWAGGVDGGAWFECSLDDEREANWCTIWSDQNGDLWARTYFVLRETGEPVPENELQYVFFSGTYIELADGRMLEPLKFHGNEERDLWEPTPIDPPRDGPPEPPSGQR